MEVRSNLSMRHCLVWETEKPFIDRPRESPVFVFMNSEWYLRMAYNSKRYPLSYEIYIINKNGLNPFPSFGVVVHIEDKRNSEPLFCKRETVSNANRTVYKINACDLLAKISDFDTYGIFTVVCVFHEFTLVKSALTIKPKRRHKSVQANFCSMEKGFKDSTNLSQCPFPNASNSSLDPTINFEALSDDLENLMDNHLFADVKLQNKDRTILAHRAILAVRSEVLNAKLEKNSEGVINVDDIDPLVLDVFLKYIYCGKIYDDLSEDIVQNLYKASDKYIVSELDNICSAFMIENLSAENVLAYLNLAAYHRDYKFKDAVIDFLTKHNKILKSASWLQFSTRDPKLANEVYETYFEKLEH